MIWDATTPMYPQWNMMNVGVVLEWTSVVLGRRVWPVLLGNGPNVRINYYWYYGDVIMATIVYSAVYSDIDQRKHQSPASLAFVRGIHRRNSPQKWPVTRKMFPFDDVIMGMSTVGMFENLHPQHQHHQHLHPPSFYILDICLFFSVFSRTLYFAFFKIRQNHVWFG